MQHTLLAQQSLLCQTCFAGDLLTTKQLMAATMSCPDQEQDTNSGQDINDLPADLRRQTAAWVERGSIPALRLVSRAWNEAANLAVRQLTGSPFLSPAQVLLIGQRCPNLERLNLDMTAALAWPDKHCGVMISSLRPLVRLQHLRLGVGAALLPEGQEFLLQQTRLLSLCTSGIFNNPGASGGLLQVIGRLSHLTSLDCNLQDQCEMLSNLMPPFQLEPATDEGVRCLSSLQSLQILGLRVNKHKSAVTGQALSTIGSLHQLTHLSLNGWPMRDTDLGHLIHLQLQSLDLSDCWHLTSGCLLHEMPLFTTLHSLDMGRGDDWCTAEELEAFKELTRDVMPFLKVLTF